MKTLNTKSMKKQLLLPISVLTILMSIIIYNFMLYKNEKNLLDATVNVSKSSLNQYKYLREYYNHEIISTLNEFSDVQIDINAEKKEGMIPLPATMMQDLSAYINKQNSGTSVKFYSNYPFPIRKDRVLDSFEKKSISFLEENKNDVFYERNIYKGKDSVRVAIADVFSNDSCVSCHNSLSGSSKKDWKIGDVGGVLEMIISIDEIVAKNRENTFYSSLIISFFLIILLFIFYILLNISILKPLNHIIKNIIKIKNGDLDKSLLLNSNNELDYLSSHIDSMRISLKTTINNLENTKNDLEDSHYELEMSLENLEKTQETLIESEKMAFLGSLVAGIAHEVNTPVGIGLTGISHFLETTKGIKDKYNNESMSEKDFEDYIVKSIEIGNLIYSNLQRTAQLITNFKQVSVDQTNEEKREFNLKEYTESILLSLGGVVTETKIKVKLEIDSNIFINSYPGILSQIIINLIINSKIHGFEEKEEGLIVIEGKEIENRVHLIYKDNGKGINPENIKKVFDPFFTTNRKNGGTGLGLNIIYNLVTVQLHGTIICNSIKNEGVEFIIKFDKK